MSSPVDQRASERVPVKSRVKVMAKGRMIAYGIALNVSMGGVLLDASPELPVGSKCELAIFPSEKDSKVRVLTEGIVVRTGAGGTAVKFLNALETERYRILVGLAELKTGNSILEAYRAYFRVGQSEGLADCEKLLGVSKRTYRTVFYSTFSACIPLATLPVWLLRESIPPAPIWAKIALSFVYAGIWLLVIQPTLDLTTFRILRARKSPGSDA